MYDELKTIIEKYNLQGLKDKYNSIESEEFPVIMGFLGEFSSGKSTLVNAILNNNILPAMEKPTSKNIVEIYFSDLEKPQYYLKLEDDLQEIDPSDFREYALGKKDGKIILEHPKNALLDENIMIVDTPGLQSLDQSDEDITFGYLPFLDAAVICIDINFGSLTDSIVNFLNKEEVKPFLENIFFAITKAGDKNVNSIDKIKSNITKQVKTIFDKKSINSKDVANKVFVIDSIDAINNDELDTYQNLSNALLYNLKNQKDKLVSEKKEKEFYSLNDLAIKSLENIKNNMSLDVNEIDFKQKSLDKDLKKLNDEMENVDAKLSSLMKNLQISLSNLPSRYKNLYAGNDNADEVNQNLINEIASITQDNIKSFFEDLKISNLSPDIESIAGSAEVVDNISNGLKLAGNVALFAWLIPGGGVAGNAAQGAGGAASVTGAKQAAKTTIRSRIAKYAKPISETIEKINPVDQVVNLSSTLAKRKLIEKKLNNNINSYLSNLKNMLKSQIENQYLLPIQQQITDLSENLRVLKEEKKNERYEHKNRLNEIENDIFTLKNI